MSETQESSINSEAIQISLEAKDIKEPVRSDASSTSVRNAYVKKTNPTFTRHYWNPEEHYLNKYETYAASATRHPCCCFKLCYCCCRDCIEPGTIDHCTCFFPSTCYYWCTESKRCCEDMIGIPLEWCFSLPCILFIGPSIAVFHNIQRCYSREHRYDRDMRYKCDGDKDRNDNDTCDCDCDCDD